MAPKQQQRVIPLIDIQTPDFTAQYERDVWWSMHGEGQDQGPFPVSFLVTTLRMYEREGRFPQQDSDTLSHIGFWFGIYHGGILSPETGAVRPGVTTLAVLDHHNGYRVGREAFFHEFEPEYRCTEQEVIERLTGLVREQPSETKDNIGIWYYCLSCLLGELSGLVFSETPTERHAWEEECRQWEASLAS